MSTGRRASRAPRCGTQIANARVGGRGTWYCPRCQPLPLAAPRSLAGWPTRPSTRSRRSTTRTIRRRGSRCSTACSASPPEASWRRVAELLEPVEGRVCRRGRLGTGADALGLASRFRVSVAGVDVSRTMVDEAGAGAWSCARGERGGAPVRRLGFDGCWADRVFQHLSDPDAALAEMVRVTRPGGASWPRTPTTTRRSWTSRTSSSRGKCSRFSAVPRCSTVHSRIAGRAVRGAELIDVVVEAAPVVLRTRQLSTMRWPSGRGPRSPTKRRAARRRTRGVGAGDRRRLSRRCASSTRSASSSRPGRCRSAAREARRRAPGPRPTRGRYLQDRGGRVCARSASRRPTGSLICTRATGDGSGRSRRASARRSRGSGRASSRSRRRAPPPPGLG